MRDLKSLAGQLMVPVLAFAYAGYALWELNDGGFHRVTIIYTTVIAVPMVILGLIAVAGDLFKFKKAPADSDGAGEEEDEAGVMPGGMRRLSWFIGVSFALVVALDWVGYLLGFFIYVIVILWVMDIRRPVTLLTIAVVMTGVVHFVFAGLLGQDLPLGLMAGMGGE